MQVTSRVIVDHARIQQLTDIAKEALFETAGALRTEVQQAQVVPRDLGTLQGEAFFVDNSQLANGKVSLVHNTRYARRLYFHPEYNFHREEWFEERLDSEGRIRRIKHDGNINAQGKWLEPWISGDNKEFCPKTFKKLYRRLLRGLR